MRTNTYLDPELVELAKSQNGGLSCLVRRLMRADWKRKKGDEGNKGDESDAPTDKQEKNWR